MPFSVPRISRCLACLLPVLVGVATAPARAFDRLVIFGDSLSDTGNVNSTFLGGLSFDPDNFDGRFSNGPVWVEYLASTLTLPNPHYSRGGGDNYAHGGATTGDGTASFNVIHNLGRQLNDFQNADTPTADDLFIVWAGANDFLDAPSLDPSIPASNLAADLNTLIDLGATNFLVPTLPPLGQTPRFQSTSDPGDDLQQDANSAALNLNLENQLDLIDNDPALAIHRLDVYDLFLNILAAPGDFGFSNTTAAARDSGPGGDPVADASGYLFWDDVHPTTTAHALLGQFAVDALNNPITGDTNLDRTIDPDDIDLLRAAIGNATASSRYDLDHNGTLDEQDVLTLVVAVLGTRPGDGDLDGDVDADDLAVLAASWQSDNARWADGDFDGNGVVDELDLSRLASNWNFNAEVPTAWSTALAATPFVPEPTTLLSWLILMPWLMARRRHGDSNGAYRARTGDLLLAKQPLSQLS